MGCRCNERREMLRGAYDAAKARDAERLRDQMAKTLISAREDARAAARRAFSRIDNSMARRSWG